MEVDFPKLEKRILKFWKENKIFEKSIEQRKNSPNFVFYEGPPTANARPGLHHVLARVFKDIICRYKTMRGFRVLRKAGWDTHGLPVELEIEKKLGLKSKKDIEKYGIARFNKKCQKSVWQYKKDWEKLTERIGFWLDIENPYITYQTDYIETVWWILKKIWQKGLLYQDFRVSPYCPRCQTVLSSHEVAQGYERIKEPAVYLKFPILNPEFKNTSLLVWTTTPWTLPGNVAVAVNPVFVYSKLKVDDEYLILAKERIENCQIKGEIIKEFKGKDLVGLRYEPPYPFSEEIIKKAYQVIPADFVSLEEGTGLVHLAPAFGQEDMEAIKIKNEPEFPILLTVNEEGEFTLDVKKFAGLFVKEADPLIIEDLKERNLLLKEELYEHDYPFCWRCHTPLLYYAKKSWFIKMTKVKKDLIRNNQKINWIPRHLKKGRFGQWLKELKDWALSRERYWGIPLPIWQCQMGKFQIPNSKFQTNSKFDHSPTLIQGRWRNSKKCGNLIVISSLKELLAQKFSTNNYYLFRHGHSLRQVKNLAMSWPEKIHCPLTKKGREEVKSSAQKLKNKKIDLIFSSDLLRTRETAEILAKELNAKIIFDKRLREYNVGVFNGKDPKLSWQYLEKKKDWLAAKIPKGESLIDLRKRMFSFLKEINEKYQRMNILIVSHELPLTILEGTLKGLSLKEILELRRERKIAVIKTGQFRKIEFKNLPFNEKMEIDLHRPHIDKIRFYCPSCKNGLMVRVPEVIDCWFDSGSMPFGQYHYPFENKALIDKKIQFPADYISEGIDQTRGWFYTLHAISTLLKNSPAYKNVISLGHVLDEKGEKMSKSKGNVVYPWSIVKKYGADAIRWYFYTINQPGDSKLFSEKEIEQALKKFILILWNSFVFYRTYRENSKLKTPASPKRNPKLQLKTKSLLDNWILSKLNGLIQETTQKLDKYDITGAARTIENFVINDLSLWYIRRSRPRFQKPKTKEELKEASQTLGFILLTLSKLTAPFLAFLSEEIFQTFVDVRHGQPRLSVHLENWPKADKKLIDKKLEEKMERVREIVSLALAERAKAKIKVRQPLATLKIKDQKSKIKEKELLDLIKEEVNVKEIIFDSKIEKEVELDTKITPQLKEEGIIREVIRNIQEMRKVLSLKPENKILVRYLASPDLEKILIKNESIILKEGKIKDFRIGKKEEKVFDLEKDLKFDQEKLWLAIKKI